MTVQKFITMEEILCMIDQKYSYAIDNNVKALLEKASVADSYKHLLTNKNVLRYFEYYAVDQGFKDRDYTKCIGVRGMTKSTEYDIQDVEKVFNTEDTKNRIDILVQKKTLQGINGLVPRPIYKDYLILCKEKSHIELVTGLTERQMQLFSVPDDLLIERMRELKQDLTDFENKFKDVKDELKDIEDELEVRGLIAERRMHLFSVPDDLLVDRTRELKQDLTELKKELKDIEDELKTRD